jgi:hypothetical protein
MKEYLKEKEVSKRIVMCHKYKAKLSLLGRDEKDKQREKFRTMKPYKNFDELIKLMIKDGTFKV